MNIGVALLDFLFPKFCLGCGKEKTYLCPECFAKIEIFSSSLCPYCSKRSPEGRICKNCQKNLNGFISASPYRDELLRKTIDVFKYQFVKELATPLAFFIWKFLQQNQEIEFFKNPLDFVIAPIPLHQRRKRERGFNQAEEIGKILSPLLKIPIQDDVLIRKRYTKPQAKLKTEKDREENIKGAFEIKNRSRTNLLRGKRIILLDDVATTLSTLEEAAKVLKQNGVKEVWGITVAKG